ncbi:MAG: hypothetical protein QF654_03860, partial [Alphaproteobacteria bacterium]|nr:hypothetical protein [Alphaproteobacteria bacterium]
MYGLMKGIAAAIVFALIIGATADAAPRPKPTAYGDHLRYLDKATYYIIAISKRCGITKEVIEKSLLKHIKNIEIKPIKKSVQEFFEAGGDRHSHNLMAIVVTTYSHGDVCASNINLIFKHLSSYYHTARQEHIFDFIHLFSWDFLAVSTKSEHVKEVDYWTGYVVGRLNKQWERDNKEPTTSAASPSISEWTGSS